MDIKQFLASIYGVWYITSSIDASFCHLLDWSLVMFNSLHCIVLAAALSLNVACIFEASQVVASKFESCSLGTSPPCGKSIMKEKLGRSPDYLDFMIQRMYFEVQVNRRQIISGWLRGYWSKIRLFHNTKGLVTSLHIGTIHKAFNLNQWIR